MASSTQAFGDAVRRYTARGGVTVPALPWIFAGWVAALGGWLDYHAPRPEPASREQVRLTLAQLHGLAGRLDALLAAVEG